MEALTTPAARKSPKPQHMLTKLVRYPRNAKGQTSAAYAVESVSEASKLDLLLEVSLTENAPGNAADQLTSEEHWERG